MTERQIVCLWAHVLSFPGSSIYDFGAARSKDQDVPSGSESEYGRSTAVHIFFGVPKIHRDIFEPRREIVGFADLWSSGFPPQPSDQPCLMLITMIRGAPYNQIYRTVSYRVYLHRENFSLP
jgi:hypothetical protein